MATDITVDTTLNPTAPMGVEGIDAPTLSLNAPTLTIPIASQQDFSAATQGSTVKFAGAGSDSTGKRAAVIAYAKQFLGTPYVWGGSSPGGFDCSGLMQYVFGKNGIPLQRVAFQQAAQGEHTSISNLQPGDMVAWYEGNTVGHIALYLGNGQILEAPHTGANVRIRSLGKGGFDTYAFGVHMNY